MRVAPLTSRVPRPTLPTNVVQPELDLTSRRLSSIMNVAVFTPYAVYLAQGKRPPMWLTLASLAWLGVNFLDDVRYLATSDNEPDMSLAGCSCTNPETKSAVPINQAYLYRVNR